MAITIQTFKANESQVEILVTSDTAITNATLFVTDGTGTDITVNFSNIPSTDNYSAIVVGNFQDGVFTLDISNSVDNLVVSICNLLKGNQALLKQTLEEKFDCVLLQQLEACRQLVLAVQGSLASDLYVDILNKAAACDSDAMFEFHIEKTSIWIENNQFVLI